MVRVGLVNNCRARVEGIIFEGVFGKLPGVCFVGFDLADGATLWIRQFLLRS